MPSPYLHETTTALDAGEWNDQTPTKPEKTVPMIELVRDQSKRVPVRGNGFCPHCGRSTEAEP